MYYCTDTTNVAYSSSGVSVVDSFVIEGLILLDGGGSAILEEFVLLEEFISTLLEGVSLSVDGSLFLRNSSLVDDAPSLHDSL